MPFGETCEERASGPSMRGIAKERLSPAQRRLTILTRLAASQSMEYSVAQFAPRGRKDATHPMQGSPGTRFGADIHRQERSRTSGVATFTSRNKAGFEPATVRVSV